MDTFYTLVGLAASESLEVTSDNHLNEMRNLENGIRQQDCTPTKHNPRIVSKDDDDDDESNKISIEFSMDHKKKDYMVGKNSRRRQIKMYTSESDSIASVSADEKARRKSPKTKSQSSYDKSVNECEASSDVTKISTFSVKEISPEVAISPPQQYQRLNNDEYAQNVQHGLSLANEALNKMKDSCETLKVENEILKNQLSELQEKYSNEVNHKNNSLNNSNKTVDNLTNKLNWHIQETVKFQADLVRSKEEGFRIYKSLHKANELIRNLENELKSLKLENENLQNKNNSQIEINNDLTNKFALLVSENENLLNKKELTEKNNRNHENEINCLKNELKTTEIELILNKNEVKKLQSDCKNYENQIHSLENKIKSLQEDKSLILKLNKEINKNLDECINESTSLRHHNSSLEDSYRDLKSQIQKLNVKLQEVQGQAKIEANALRRELNAAKEQSTNFQRQLISNCPTSRITPQASCQNSTTNISEKLSQEKLELEQELSTYQKKYREIKKLYMQGLIGEKLTKKQSPKTELEKLYDYIGDFDSMASCSNLTIDFRAQLEDPQNLLLIKQVASLISNERNVYWCEKSKEELEESRKKIRKMDEEIKHLKNKISKATAVIKC